MPQRRKVTEKLKEPYFMHYIGTDREYFYCWHDKNTGERKSELFLSRVAARNWLNEKYWRPVKFETIDQFYKHLGNKGQKAFSAKYWIRDTYAHENFEMKAGFLDYFDFTSQGATRDPTRNLVRAYLEGSSDG